MKKIKLLTLLFIPAIFLASCKNSVDPYKDRIVKDSTVLKVTNAKSDYKSGETLDVNQLKVTYDGNPVDYEGDTPNPVEKKYFITKSNTTPSLSRVTMSNLTLKISEEKRDQVFYVGYLVSNDGALHVSTSITIHITNDKAMKTWVYWVVGAVVIVGASLLVFLTKKYKDNH